MAASSKTCADTERSSFQMTSQRAVRFFFSIIFTVAVASCIDPENYPTVGNNIEKTTAETLDYNLYRNYSAEHLLNQDWDSMAEFRDFDPAKLEKMLIEKAASHSTPPIQYQEELKDLITYYQTEVETRGRYQKDSKIYNLEQKYNISVGPKSTESDTITYLRLTLMFPQYYNFDRVYKSKVQKRCPFLSLVMPPIMRHPFFGGLIPQSDAGVDKTARAEVIFTHLYWLSCISDESITIDKLAKELFERIEKSLLPNKLRIYILQRKKILASSNYAGYDCRVVYQNLPKIVNEALLSIDWARPY